VTAAFDPIEVALAVSPIRIFENDAWAINDSTSSRRSIGPWICASSGESTTHPHGKVPGIRPRMREFESANSGYA
jgi:hypothetical protein